MKIMKQEWILHKLCIYFWMGKSGVIKPYEWGPPKSWLLVGHLWRHTPYCRCSTCQWHATLQRKNKSKKKSARLAWLDPHTESIEVPHEIHDWILLDKYINTYIHIYIYIYYVCMYVKTSDQLDSNEPSGRQLPCDVGARHWIVFSLR